LLFLLLMLLLMLLLLLQTRSVACSAKCQVVLADAAGAVRRAPACLPGGGVSGMRELCALALALANWAKQTQGQHSQNVLTSTICDQAYTT
jgi:hypothetical protein